MPCARAIRPTTAISFQFIADCRWQTSDSRTAICHLPSEISPALPYLQGHRLAFALAGGRRQRPKRGGRPALTAKHLAEIAGRDEQLDDGHLLALRLGHPDRVRPVGQYLREHFDGG